MATSARTYPWAAGADEGAVVATLWRSTREMIPLFFSKSRADRSRALKNSLRSPFSALLLHISAPLPGCRTTRDTALVDCQTVIAGQLSRNHRDRDPSRPGQRPPWRSPHQKTLRVFFNGLLDADFDGQSWRAGCFLSHLGRGCYTPCIHLANPVAACCNGEPDVRFTHTRAVFYWSTA